MDIGYRDMKLMTPREQEEYWRIINELDKADIQRKESQIQKPTATTTKIMPVDMFDIDNPQCALHPQDCSCIFCV